jgi:hypothetical protein
MQSRIREPVGGEQFTDCTYEKLGAKQRATLSWLRATTRALIDAKWSGRWKALQRKLIASLKTIKAP